MEIAGLRLIHLLFGILWAGGGMIVGFWLTPAAAAAGPGGPAVMRGVMVDRKLPQVLTVSGLLTILSGLRLYQLRFSTGWLTTPEGIVLTLGLLLGLGAFFIGLMVVRPTAGKLMDLGAQVAASGGPPSAEQGKELGALSAKLVRSSRILAIHLAATVLLMSFMRMAQALS